MKQLLQSLKDGSTELSEVPAPKFTTGQNLISTSTTLVSVGTERMLVEFGRANILQKARSQPDKVKMVLSKAKTDGVISTIDAVKSKLDQPMALGYCNVGRIIETDVDGFATGDRVVSNGKHAEVVSVAKNLCAKIPDNVSDESAAFTVVSAIGLQGIRLVNPTLGETVVVTGLGLIGLLTVQMLVAHGCRVFGIDVDPARIELARSFGAETCNPNEGEDVIGKAKSFSRGTGVDAVIITAASTSNDIVSQAANMCRQRGRIVLVGVVGLELSRADFYEKELTFQVSCSYGPGRYDHNYERNGMDYPIGFVRWTEQRNFQAVLDMMSSGLIKLDQLITHRFDISEGSAAFSLLVSDEPALGILLSFGKDDDLKKLKRKVNLTTEEKPALTGSREAIGFFGAGNYAGRVLIPAFKASNANLLTLVSGGGVSAVYFGKKFKFKTASTDPSLVFKDEKINTVVVATQHDLHASQVLSALENGKSVFCEKPLCLTLTELDAIQTCLINRPNQKLMVGFNRRFAPHVRKMKQLLDRTHAPKSVIITVNAGHIPSDHWTQDPIKGGGRIIGEACHFIDLARHLVDSPISNHYVQLLGANDASREKNDKVTMSLAFDDGSFAAIHYLANGHKSFPKERVEVFVDGRVLQLDNFLKLRGWGWKNFKSMRLWRQDKGQRACVAAFLKALRGKAPTPIDREQLFEVSRVSIEVAKLASKS